MATTRTPLKRRLRSRITPEAVEAFKIGLRTADQYWACIRDEACELPSPKRRHCDTCLQHKEASRTLNRILGLMPWDFSPLDIELGEPKPAYLVDSDLCSSKTWDQVVELRRELLKAASRD